MATQPRQQHGLGRLAAPDQRDLNFLMRAAHPRAFAMPLEALPQSISYTRGPILDQGRTGCCVEFSLRGKLQGAPIMVPEERMPPLYSIYDAAIRIDEFPDNDNDTARQMGTSVRAGCKVLQELGFISAYHWAYEVEEIGQWMLSGQGGLNLGISWFNGMETPSKEGIIRARGAPEGGHAIYAFGYDRKNGFILLQNSWSESWGGWTVKSQPDVSYKGCCKLPLEDLRKLLKGDGEAAAITETPLVGGAAIEHIEP